MLRFVVVVVLISSVPAEAAPSFATLSERDQATRADQLAQTFPAAWHAKVRVDAVGMAEQVELAVTIPLAEAEPRIADIVRERAAWFGIADTAAMHMTTRYSDVIFGVGERWTGSLVASVQSDHIILWGHLWPVATPRVSTEPAERVLKPFIGLGGSVPSRCLCGHDDVGITTRRETFELHGGIALVCAGGVMRPRAAIAIQVMLGSVRSIPGLEKLPELIDAHTLEPITGGYEFPLASTHDDGANTFTATRLCR
ncbi:MAG TPA: hypothetical protein VGO00_18560 [Kofleriaceae bacterium]|nr:hypothetical protein [Kofleriaceae bacterium]